MSGNQKLPGLNLKIIINIIKRSYMQLDDNNTDQDKILEPKN